MGVGDDHLYGARAPAAVSHLSMPHAATTKGCLILCTVLGLTSNLSATPRNLVALPAGTLGDLPQLALLIDRGLLDCGNPEVESGAFHGKSPHLSADTVSDLVRKIFF